MNAPLILRRNSQEFNFINKFKADFETKMRKNFRDFERDGRIKR